MSGIEIEESFRMTDEESKKFGFSQKKSHEHNVYDEAVLQRIEELASKGLTVKQIADYFGINRMTFLSHRKKHPEIDIVIRKGKAKTIGIVAGYLFKQIKDGSTPATIFYLKTQAGWCDPSLPQNQIQDQFDEDNEDKKEYTLNTLDPIEAAKRYQQIMMRGTKK